MKKFYPLFFFLFLFGCENKRSLPIQKEINFETIEVDSLSPDSLLKFIQTEVDTFDNDTTYSFQCQSEIKITDPLYTSIFLLPGNSLHIRFLISKSIYDDYTPLEFKCNDGEIKRIILHPQLYSGTGQTYLHWNINSLGNCTGYKPSYLTKSTLSSGLRVFGWIYFFLSILGGISLLGSKVGNSYRSIDDIINGNDTYESVNNILQIAGLAGIISGVFVLLDCLGVSRIIDQNTYIIKNSNA